MSHAELRRKLERLDLRATPAQARTIRAAARATDRTLTAFVMETAFEEAQRILADSSHLVLEDAEWQAFNEILERPAVLKPRLAALLASHDANPS